MVQEAVEDCPGGCGVSQHLAPVLHRPVGSKDDCPFLIAAHEDFQQVYFAELSNDFLAGAGGVGLGHVLGNRHQITSRPRHPDNCCSL